MGSGEVKLTGVKIYVYAERGRPSSGILEVIVPPEAFKAIKLRGKMIHVWLDGGPEWQDRLILNGEQVANVLVEGGRHDLFRGPAR